MERRETEEILETNVVTDRMDNESHQLGSLGDLHLSPHDARQLVVSLGDGGRDHEPDEVGQEDQVEGSHANEDLPTSRGQELWLRLLLGLLLDWLWLLLGFEKLHDVQHSPLAVTI